MKKLTLTVAAFVSLLITSQAFAFITVIDVQEPTGQMTTIQNSSDYSLGQMNRKFLSYRGQADEAVTLFSSVVQNEAPLAVIDVDINEETGTIATTVAVNGYFGFEYYYYVLKKSGN